MKSKILIINIMLLCLITLLPVEAIAINYCFIENKGQWNREVKYLFKGKNYRAWVTNSGVVYDYFERSNDTIKGDVVKISFHNSNSNPKFTASKKLQTKHNYFIGNNPNNWATDVELCKEIYLENIYDGINIKYYIDTLNGNNLRYDFEVLPFSNPNLIQFHVEGPDSIIINANNELELCFRNKTYKHTNLLAYQSKQIECKFKKNQYFVQSYGFEVGQYDITKKLIIDPLIYSLLIGGDAADYAYSVTTDNTGAVYWTGFTYSNFYRTTYGSYQTFKTDGSDNQDVIVSKVGPSGEELLFSTYIGGYNNDVGRYIKVDELNQIYIVGESDSNPVPDNTEETFPVKAPANATIELTTYKDGTNTFLTKLSPDGKRLDMSVLIGANNDDNAGGLNFIMEYDALTQKDTLKSIVVVSQMHGNRVPIVSPFLSTDAAQKVFGGGENDCYVAVIDKTGTNIEYATFWGGSGDESPESVAVDKNNNIYIAAQTTSKNIPVSNGAVYGGSIGGNDIIVTKFDSTLSTMLYSTYIGGTATDELGGMDIDSAGCAYITGSTFSANFPVTKLLTNNPLKADIAGIFITKLNKTGDTIVYSAAIASTNSNYATSIVVDAECNAHIAGHTVSEDFPITWDAFFEKHSGFGDALYSVINPTGDSLVFSSYIGGSQYDWAYGLTLDKISAAYICGVTTHNNASLFPHSNIIADSHDINEDPNITTIAPWLNAYDAFIFKSMYKPYPGELETSIEWDGTMFCQGDNLTIAIFAEHGFYYPDNEFRVQLSDINGNFTQDPNARIIGRVQASGTTTVNIAFQPDLPASKNYRIRVISSHPRSIGAPNASPLDISPPYIELDSTLFTGVCLADSVEIPIQSNQCFSSNNIYTLELSDETGSFNAPTTLATQPGNGSRTFKIELPESVKPNVTYKLRCASSSPRVVSNIVDFNIIKPVATLNTAAMNSLQNRCAGNEIAFNFTATRCFDENNIFYLVLSDSAGSFALTSDTIGSTALEDVSSTTDIDIPLSMQVKIPTDLPFSKNYKIKLISTSPQQEYILSENNIAINFTLGLPFIFTDNLRSLQICYDDSTNIDLNIHNCFEEDNEFQAFVQTDDNKWILVGTSKPNSTNLSVFIPSGQLISSNTFVFIKSNNSVVYSDTISLLINSKEATIVGHTPAELCANDSFALICSANFCVRDSMEMSVELSINDSTFEGSTQIIGTGKILGSNSIINCQLPTDINYNANHYVRLIDGNNYQSKHFLLSIYPQSLSITTEPADVEVLCSGITFYIDFAAIGCFDIENVFSIVLSDVTGNFESADAQIIGNITSSNSGRIQVHIPIDIQEGSGYKIKIVSSHPQVESVLDVDITIQSPYILIDSYSNLTQCDPNPVLPKQEILTQADGNPYVRFIASACFGKDNIFILQFGKEGDFSAPINVDSCAWNEREFNFIMPPNMGTDAYRFRIISTVPNISSDENGFDVRYNQPYATLVGATNPMICRNKDFIFSYMTSECFEEGNTFYLEMSDEYGSFATPIILDENTDMLSGRFTIKVPETVPYNKTYKLRIRSTTPAGSFIQNQVEFVVRGPEILTGNLNRINIRRNDTLYVPFNCNCLDMDGKLFVAQLSGPYGNFDNILEIGNKIGWESNGKIYTRISLDASDGNRYRIRVVCKDPAIVGTDNGKDITIFGITVPEDVDESDNIAKPDIRPSPFCEELEVIMPENMQNDIIKNIAILDLLGRQCIKIDNNILQNNTNTIHIDTAELKVGAYMIFIETNNNTYKKLIIKSYNSSNL